MGAKYNNLVKLYDKKINIHNFVEIIEMESLLKYSSIYPKFSMRFDRDYDFHQLPFYKYNKDDFDSELKINDFFANILEEAKKLNCTLLCSNGYGYNDIQICNFVIKIDNNHDFVLEWSTKNVALREMYQYKTSVLKGNIKDNLIDMQWIFKTENEIDNKYIEEILSWAFEIGFINKHIEGTLYPIEVGMLNEKIVCWQID